MEESKIRGRPFVRKEFVCFVMLLAPFIWPGTALAQQPVGTPASAVVIVDWSTESEVNLAGFNLYRSDDPQGPYLKVNDALIPASRDPVTGGSYAYADTTVAAALTYYYKLEDVELDGSSTMHGPIEAVAQADAEARRFPVGGPEVLFGLLAGLLLGAALIVAVRRRGTRPAPDTS